jgi:ABC-type Na+ efflux pump permease subunit
MDKLWIIARKDLREAFRSRTTYFYIVILIFLSFTYFSTYMALANQVKNSNGGHAALVQVSQFYINSLINTLPLWYAVFICTIFAAYSVIVDKARRNLESLMATPVSLNQIWMAKTLAVAFPSIVIALIETLLVYLVMSFAVISPTVGSVLIPDAVAIVTAVVLAPVLIFVIVAIVIYFQLVMANPRIANFAFTGIFLLLFFGGSYLSGRGQSQPYSLVYIAIIITGGVAAYILSRRLTKEKVVLSSKG